MLCLSSPCCSLPILLSSVSQSTVVLIESLPPGEQSNEMPVGTSTLRLVGNVFLLYLFLSPQSSPVGTLSLLLHVVIFTSLETWKTNFQTRFPSVQPQFSFLYQNENYVLPHFSHPPFPPLFLRRSHESWEFNCWSAILMRTWKIGPIVWRAGLESTALPDIISPFAGLGFVG